MHLKRADLAEAITADEFASLMAGFGPFETAPHVAVGCSGGADSACLALLLHDWAVTRGGAATALVVDHGLREESGAEAAAAAAALQSIGMQVEVMRAALGRVAGDVQAAARRARFALLTGWCLNRGVVHLALAHHQEDQAETLLLRLARGSGVDGMSAMAPVTEMAGLRVLRPFLPVSRCRVRATLAPLGYRHVEDPSNRNSAFARVRMRALAPSLAAEGLSSERLATTAQRMARVRLALDDEVARRLAEAVRVWPEGYAEADAASLCAPSEEVSLRCLARIVQCIGGGEYPPREEGVIRLYRSLLSAESRARTIAGCRIIPRRGGILICREPAAAGDVLKLGGTAGVWDGRFRMGIRGSGTGLSVRRLGAAGCMQVNASGLDVRWLPAAVRPSLPAIWRERDLLAVPHLAYRSPEAVNMQWLSPVFAPPRPLGEAGFTFERHDGHTI